MLRYVFPLVLAVAIALILGGWSARWALEETTDLGTVAIGPWQADPYAGSPDADPYAKARLARLGNLTLGIGEGIQFQAATDSAGRPLRRECQYTIEGLAPPARLWTLTPYSPGGRLVHSATGRRGLMVSSKLMRREDNSFTISVGPEARPGNWLSTAGTGPLVLAFSFYDTPVSTSSGAESLRMPPIERNGCVGG